jgi:hypothetical protein
MMEHRLQETLQSMEEQWRNYSLPIRSLGQSGTYYIVAVRDATAIIQDQVIKLDSVMSADTENRYSEGTEQWRGKVLYMQQLLEVWWTTQRHFLRIRPIFASRSVLFLPIWQCHSFLACATYSCQGCMFDGAQRYDNAWI